MKLTIAKLLKMKVRHSARDGEVYFSVEEIRNKFPNHRCPPDKIKEVPVNGVFQQGIKAEDIQELSEFEKKMIKLYNFRDK